MVPTPRIKVDCHHLHDLVPDVPGMMLSQDIRKVAVTKCPQKPLSSKAIKVSSQGQLHPSISGMQLQPKLWSYWKYYPDDDKDIK